MKISGLKPIKSSQVLKAIELCEKEGESGDHYKYVIENGRMPKWIKKSITLVRGNARRLSRKHEVFYGMSLLPLKGIL